MRAFPILTLLLLAAMPSPGRGEQKAEPLGDCYVADGGDGYVPTVDKVRNYGGALILRGIDERSYSFHTYTIPETATHLAKVEEKVNAFCANPTQSGSKSLASELAEVGKFLHTQDEFVSFIREHGPKVARGMADLGSRRAELCRNQVEAFVKQYVPVHESNKQKVVQFSDKLKGCGAQAPAAK